MTPVIEVMLRVKMARVAVNKQVPNAYILEASMRAHPRKEGVSFKSKVARRILFMRGVCLSAHSEVRG